MVAPFLENLNGLFSELVSDIYQWVADLMYIVDKAEEFGVVSTLSNQDIHRSYWK